MTNVCTKHCVNGVEHFNKNHSTYERFFSFFLLEKIILFFFYLFRPCYYFFLLLQESISFIKHLFIQYAKQRGIQRGCATPTGATSTKSEEKNSFIENPQTDLIQYK